jgi:hypothetical protein
MFVGRIEAAAIMRQGPGRTLLCRQKPTLHGVVFQFFVIGSNPPRLDDRPGGGLARLHHPNMQLAQLLSPTLPPARPSSDLQQRWFHREQHHHAQVLLAAQRHDEAVDVGRSGFTPA